MTTHEHRTDQGLNHSGAEAGDAAVAAASTPPAWPLGQGEMAGLIRRHDWAATSLGPVEAWPQSLRTAVDMMLAMPGAATVLWGSAAVQLYNDTYVAIARDRHPTLLGRPAAEGWPDAYEAVIAPLLDATRAGRATQLADFPVTLRAADGELEERVFDTAWSPIRDEAGTVAGALQTLVEVTDRHRTEAALRVSEARCRAFVTASSDVIYRMNPDWGEMRELDGRGFLADTPEPSRSWLERYIHPDDQADVLTVIEDAIRTKRVFELEHRVRRVDGSLGWTLSRAVPLLDAAGEIAEWFGTASDVTARKKAEARLRESEVRLAAVFKSLPVGVGVMAIDGALVLANPAMQRFLPTGIIPSRDPARRARWRALYSDGRPTEPGDFPGARALRGEHVVPGIEMIYRGDDEREVWTSVSSAPIQDAEGKTTGGVVVVADTDVARRAAEALHESEERFRQFGEASQDILWIRNGETLQWIYVTPAFEAIYGLTREEALAGDNYRGWQDLIVDEDRAHAVESIRRVGAGERVTFEYRIRRPVDGQVRWLRNTDFPMFDASGRVARIGGVGHDVTAAKRGEAALRELNEELERRVAERTGELMAAETTLRQVQKMDAVGQLASGIAHDFNNMLQGIAGSLELTRRRTEQGRLTDAARHIENARGTVQRAAGLTHRLLAFSRQQTLEPTPVNLDELVGGMAELIRRTMGLSIQVEVRLADGSWPVLCDASQMENALLNLCVNARDAMPNGGWLTILTEEARLSADDLAGEPGLTPGLYGTVSVTDTGSGMTPEVIARVFEPFYTTKPLGKGTGLGLSQVYGFVRQSGGFVRIESAPGQGTTVRLHLPRHATADARDEDVTASPVVLLIEDEANLREGMSEWLRDAGFRVLEASDGAAALRLLHGGGRVSILVTDIGLPGGMNGREVAEAARLERPGLPVLFITGYADAPLRTALPEGAALIDKPFALDELAARVGSLLEAVRQ